TNLVWNDADRIPDIVRVPLSHILESVSIRGGPTDDILNGSERDDYIMGLDGDDFIKASPGSDLIDGGPGFDVVSYEYSKDEIDRTVGAAGENFIGKPGNDFDTLLGIEKIELLDGSYILDLSGLNTDFTYRMYAAAYGRTP